MEKEPQQRNLRACARHGDAALIRRLAAENARFKGAAEQQGLLHIACQRGNLETAKALLELGVDPNKRKQCTILSTICNSWRGASPKVEIVSLLLQFNADPRIGNPLPLNSCAACGFLDCAKALYTKLNTVNQRQPGSWKTPLMCACEVRNWARFEGSRLEMIRWLVVNGADLPMQSSCGFTPMDFALGADSFSSDPTVLNFAPAEVIKFLHEVGARPTEKFRPILDQLISRNFVF